MTSPRKGGIRTGEALAGRRQRGSAGESARRSVLRAPTLPAHYLRRERLLRALDDLLTTPLVLVSAPAGTGKTSLLAGWSEESDRPVGWLSLDETDSDPSAFANDLAEAIDQLVRAAGEPAIGAARGDTTPSDVMARLADELGNRHGPESVLVVDNLHVVDCNDETTTLLAQLVAREPDSLHIALAGRRLPRLPVNRLRAAGQLVELHSSDLMFSTGEASQLLADLVPTAAREEIEALVDRAGGWAAALQLAASAARAAQAGGDQEATGRRYTALLHSYVMHEVLGSEPAELVDALTQFAVTRQVNAELGQVLTGRDDAAAVLDAADAQGLFVARPSVDSWFALHPLIRDVLLGVRQTHPASRLAEQHTRAAQWYEARGDIPEALEQWLLAGQPKTALRVLADHAADLYDRGDQAIVVKNLAAIPADAATAGLAEMVAYAGCELLVSRRRFLELVDQIGWWAQQSPPHGVLGPRVTMLQSFAAALRGEWDRSATLARAALRELGEDAWRDRLGRFGWNMVAREIAFSERWDDTGDEERELRLAISRDTHRWVAADGARALGQALAGQPAHALRTAEAVWSTAPVASMSILRAELTLAEATAHRERGERAPAAAALVTLAANPPEPMIHFGVLALLELSQLRLDEGDLPAAETAFEDAVVAAQATTPGFDDSSRLATVATLVRLRGGHVETARVWAEQIQDPFWLAISRARVHLARGDREQARQATDAAIPRCARHTVIQQVTRARAVDDVEALALVSAAVKLAVECGMQQTVASEGAEVIRLVERVAWAVPPTWADAVRRLEAGCDLSPPSGRPAEQLSPREWDVLRMLASRLTIREIAEHLGVSVNTVKYHVKGVYRKLAVSSRAEAVEAVRRSTTGLQPRGAHPGPAEPEEEPPSAARA